MGARATHRGSKGRRRIGYLGPPGTFTEEALLSQPDWSGAELVALASHAQVLGEVGSGGVELGLVPIENSIEGSVNETLDGLVFGPALLIQREVVLDVHQNLLARSGTALGDVKAVLSYPVATAQCTGYLSRELPGAEVVATNSTADAARQVAEGGEQGLAALGPAVAAQLYGLEVVAAGVEDHHNNQTRFVAVAREGVPPATGHDRTSVVCFQAEDRPGSLHSILGQFAARGINLSRLESRPSKRSLGEYCFIIDMEGHVEDEIVADCLRDLHAQLAELRFLGSYPASGEHGPAKRRDAAREWREASEWVESLRRQVRRLP